MPGRPSIICELLSPSAIQAAALAEIATRCAQTLGQPLTVRTLCIDRTVTRVPVLTLHLPVALAARQHRVWCLACQLACTCPGARISILIRGEEAFAPPQPAPAALRSRSA